MPNAVKFNAKHAIGSLLFGITLVVTTAHANSDLPIADAHVHYSHDSVEFTPPERVIELMREANLKFALVSSSDDNGTQRLFELAPDLIIPGLRPYRKRGETGTWFTDDAALEYVETLLSKHAYASIGEFHLYGDSADLDIPRRIVELADEYNLVLHAHSDADAVERLLSQSETVKVIWAHSGFDSPEDVGLMLKKHDRLWADLAFRSEIGSGGVLSQPWKEVFAAFPDRFMLGTDTYTPERIYFIPEHAAGARVWLDTLPDALAENIAWKNAYDLLMPIWNSNRKDHTTGSKSTDSCSSLDESNTSAIDGDGYKIWLEPDTNLQVSQVTSVTVSLCGDIANISAIQLDASMPAHGHGTNYTPTASLISKAENFVQYRVDGVVLHMPGEWRWEMQVRDSKGQQTIMKNFTLE